MHTKTRFLGRLKVAASADVMHARIQSESEYKWKKNLRSIFFKNRFSMQTKFFLSLSLSLSLSLRKKRNAETLSLSLSLFTFDVFSLSSKKVRFERTNRERERERERERGDYLREAFLSLF